MKKFRVLINVLRVGDEPKKYYVFVRDEWETVQCLEEHLKSLFGLPSCEIEVDGAILPSRETIDIIEPTDTLTVSIKNVPKSPKVRNSSCTESVDQESIIGFTDESMPTAGSGKIERQSMNGLPRKTKKEMLHISRSVGHIMGILRQETERPTTSEVCWKKTPLADDEHPPTTSKICLPSTPLTEEDSCANPEENEDSLVENSIPDQFGAKKRKRKRKKKLQTEPNRLEFAYEKRKWDGPQHVRFDIDQGNEEECSNQRESDDCESETVENPLNKYLKMAKTGSKFKFTRNESETDENSTIQKTKSKFGNTSVNGSTEERNDPNNFSDLPTQLPPFTSSTPPKTVDQLDPDIYPPVSDPRINDTLLFKYKKSETETSELIVAQVSDKFVDSLRIDILGGDRNAIVGEDGNHSCWVKWEDLIEPRLKPMNGHLGHQEEANVFLSLASNFLSSITVKF